MHSLSVSTCFGLNILTKYHIQTNHIQKQLKELISKQQITVKRKEPSQNTESHQYRAISKATNGNVNKWNQIDKEIKEGISFKELASKYTQVLRLLVAASCNITMLSVNWPWSWYNGTSHITTQVHWYVFCTTTTRARRNACSFVAPEAATRMTRIQAFIRSSYKSTIITSYQLLLATTTTTATIATTRRE